MLAGKWLQGNHRRLLAHPHSVCAHGGRIGSIGTYPLSALTLNVSSLMIQMNGRPWPLCGRALRKSLRAWMSGGGSCGSKMTMPPIATESAHSLARKCLKDQKRFALDLNSHVTGWLKGRGLQSSSPPHMPPPLKDLLCRGYVRPPRAPVVRRRG